MHTSTLRFVACTWLLCQSLGSATIVTDADPDDRLNYQAQCTILHLTYQLIKWKQMLIGNLGVRNISDYAADSGPPRSYGMLLFRGYEHLDVFGPLDILSSLSLKTPLSLALIAESMEPVTSQPQMNLPVNSSVWARLLPTHTFETAPDIEVLFVPGGPGTRAPAAQFDNTFRWIEATFPKLRYLVTVCTGSLLVSRTTVLNSRNATTNKLAFNSVAANNPAVDWFPSARWVVDGNIWTSSGVTAGIDVTFAFIECFFGKELADSTAKFIEYTRNTDPRVDPFAVDL